MLNRLRLEDSYGKLLSKRKDKTMAKKNYTSYDQLPLSLSADDIAEVLSISRAGAYTLMHSVGFPTVVIGRRLTTPKDKFLAWLDQKAKM